MEQEQETFELQEQEKEPASAISIQLYPNPDNSLEEVVAQSLEFSVHNNQIAVWLQFDNVRLVIRPPYRTVNEYTRILYEALKEASVRRADAHRSPQVALLGVEEPSRQPIITEIAPNSPFHKQ